jgi:hypothetical protein
MEESWARDGVTPRRKRRTESASARKYFMRGLQESVLRKVE